MKTILQLFLAISLLVSCVKANETDHHNNEFARCTGSASCTACSNCTRCAHCSSGGSCGVCAGSSSGRSFYSSPSRSTKKKKSVSSGSNSYGTLGIYSQQKPQPKANGGNYSKTISAESLFVKKENVNIRELPSLSADVIAVVGKYTALKNLGKTGDWYKVEIQSKGQVGYVYESLVE